MSKGGIGFVGLLTVAFIILKLVGVIAWGWLWIFSPIWIAIIFWILVIVVLAKIFG